ncbi:MAG TPA: hypothetical protein PKI73_11185 [Petrotogaceae bacterium]|nr:hypothetical protein [Bacteroidales bacterium]HNY38542.1 hypothetical protein [Petrotogaceae bacterium]HPO27164.1 hypothetical protein [Petrotogaceae bacterium]HQC41365.1 hypothetical protein [Petrotogaceae bacterium]
MSKKLMVICFLMVSLFAFGIDKTLAKKFDQPSKTTIYKIYDRIRIEWISGKFSDSDYFQARMVLNDFLEGYRYSDEEVAVYIALKELYDGKYAVEYYPAIKEYYVSRYVYGNYDDNWSDDDYYERYYKDFTRYDNNYYDFSFMYPRTWNILDESSSRYGGYLKMSVSKYYGSGYVTVEINQISRYYGLTDTVEKFLKDINNQGDPNALGKADDPNALGRANDPNALGKANDPNSLKKSGSSAVVLDKGNYRFGSDSAYRVTYTFNGQKILKIWSIQKDYLFVVTFAADNNTFDSSLETFYKFLDSFEFE